MNNDGELIQNIYIDPHSQLLSELIKCKLNFYTIYNHNNVIRYIKGIEVNSFDLKQNYLKADNEIIERIYLLLDAYDPIFSRWYHKGHLYEDLKEDFVIKIIRLINFIKKEEIKLALFPTGVCHHIDTYCYEVALNICECKQIFLYPEAIRGRLLPYVQEKGIETRRPLNKVISKYDYAAPIENLIATRKIQDKPKIKHKIYNAIKKNFYTEYSISASKEDEAKN